MYNKENTFRCENLKAEYNALRNEITNLENIRHQIVVLSITFLGVLLAFSSHYTSSCSILLLIYPIINNFIIDYWVHINFRIREIGKYIREEIEPVLPLIHWEFYLQSHSKNPKNYIRIQRKAVAGLFVISNIIAITTAFLFSIFIFRTSTQIQTGFNTETTEISLYIPFIINYVPSSGSNVEAGLFFIKLALIAITIYLTVKIPKKIFSDSLAGKRIPGKKICITDIK